MLEEAQNKQMVDALLTANSSSDEDEQSTEQSEKLTEENKEVQKDGHGEEEAKPQTNEDCQAERVGEQEEEKVAPIGFNGQQTDMIQEEAKHENVSDTSSEAYTEALKLIGADETDSLETIQEQA